MSRDGKELDLSPCRVNVARQQMLAAMSQKKEIFTQLVSVALGQVAILVAYERGSVASSQIPPELQSLYSTATTAYAKSSDGCIDGTDTGTDRSRSSQGTK